MKDVVLPNISYLSILYSEKDEFSVNFEEEINTIEDTLSAWGITHQDLQLIKR
jgi:hypothetical protein